MKKCSICGKEIEETESLCKICSDRDKIKLILPIKEQDKKPLIITSLILLTIIAIAIFAASMSKNGMLAMFASSEKVASKMCRTMFEKPNFKIANKLRIDKYYIEYKDSESFFEENHKKYNYECEYVSKEKLDEFEIKDLEEQYKFDFDETIKIKEAHLYTYNLKISYEEPEEKDEEMLYMTIVKVGSRWYVIEMDLH